jgi:hypothetical protein
MSCAVKDNLEICRGATFSKVWRWESDSVVFTPITGITKAAPPVVTAAGHGAPNGWSVAITGAKGMTEINAANNPPKRASQYVKCRVLTANTLELSKVDASDYSAYASGGILRYNQPVDLAGYTARLHFRESVDSDVILLASTTENGGLALDNTLKTITLTISATDTTGLTWGAAVFDGLEMVSPGGVVTRLVKGAVSVSPEGTR